MKEKLSRRDFLKLGAAAGASAGAKFFMYRLGIGAKAQQEHKIYLPFVSKPERPLDDLVRLFNENLSFVMRTNPAHPRADWEALLSENQKKEIIYHWVENESDVPWLGATQLGKEIDGETGMTMQTMMAYYSGDPQRKTVECWIWANPEFAQYRSQRNDEPLTTLYSRVHSFNIWKVIVAPDRGFLWGEFSVRNPTPEEIENYFMARPLILVSPRS